MDVLLAMLSSGKPSLEDEALAWKAISLACEAELARRSSGNAHELAACEGGISGLRARFAVEKEKVLVACRAHAEARLRPASAAPLSLATRAVLLPSFQEPTAWKHAWADTALTSEHLQQLRTEGFCILGSAFQADLASDCLKECTNLDKALRTTVTTNRCNRGSRSTWLDLADSQSRNMLHQQLPALTELSLMLAGLPARVEALGGHGAGNLQVHPASMIAVYPEQAASYSLHKDSYAPSDNDPATGASRRLTVLAYLNDWRPGNGGELCIPEAKNNEPDPRRFHPVAPSAGCVVIFDSRAVWHAVAPSLSGDRWAMTLWIH